MKAKIHPPISRAPQALLVLLLILAAIAPASGIRAAAPPATGLWQPAAPPPAQLYGGAATLLPDGTVLVRAARYNPTTDSWRTLTPAIDLGHGPTQTLLPDGRVLLVGAAQIDAMPEAVLRAATLYNPTTDTWAAAAAMASARVGHTATLLSDGTVLVVGGTINGGTAERYNPGTDTWTPTPPLAVARSGHTATLLTDGRVLIVGGKSPDNTILASAEIYNPTLNTWTPAAALQGARTAHAATLLANGQAIVIGGTGPAFTQMSVEQYNPVLDTWTVISGLRDPRTGHAATLLADGTVLIVGGSVDGLPSASAERYDPLTTDWQRTFGLRAKAGIPLLTPLADGSALVVREGYANRFDPAAPAPVFTDVPSGGFAHEAITQLAARGIVGGYGNGQFGRDELLFRAQAAAIITRGMAWEREGYANPFPDQGAVDDELWRSVATLAHYRVALGYPDGTYDPTGPVLKVQVISLVTRAQLARGYWVPREESFPIYTNVPESSGARAELLQFVAHAGPIPGQSDTSFWGDWDQPATRGWTARVIWQAFSAPGGAAR